MGSKSSSRSQEKEAALEPLLLPVSLVVSVAGVEKGEPENLKGLLHPCSTVAVSSHDAEDYEEQP